MPANTEVWTLDANGEATPWMDFRDLIEFFFQAVISGTLTLAFEIANDPAKPSVAKSDARVFESYTASISKICRSPLPRFGRLKITAFTSGSAIVSFGRGVRENGSLVDVRPQAEANSGPSSEFQ